jgi:hypothetical protein
MKRMEKQRAKAERRAQRKLEKREGGTTSDNLEKPLDRNENTAPPGPETA